jgi:hypothetical protein
MRLLVDFKQRTGAIRLGLDWVVRGVSAVLEVGQNRHPVHRPSVACSRWTEGCLTGAISRIWG